MGLRTGLDRCGKFRPSPGINPRTVQPVGSRCADYATRPPCNGSYRFKYLYFTLLSGHAYYISVWRFSDRVGFRNLHTEFHIMLSCVDGLWLCVYTRVGTLIVATI